MGLARHMISFPYRRCATAPCSSRGFKRDTNSAEAPKPQYGHVKPARRNTGLMIYIWFQVCQGHPFDERQAMGAAYILYRNQGGRRGDLQAPQSHVQAHAAQASRRQRSDMERGHHVAL